MKMVKMSLELSLRCARALIDQHNNMYDQMSPSVRLVSFQTLYDDLREIGHELLICEAKAEEDVRDLIFSPSRDKLQAYLEKHGIGRLKS